MNIQKIEDIDSIPKRRLWFIKSKFTFTKIFLFNIYLQAMKNVDKSRSETWFLAMIQMILRCFQECLFIFVFVGSTSVKNCSFYCTVGKKANMWVPFWKEMEQLFKHSDSLLIFYFFISFEQIILKENILYLIHSIAFVLITHTNFNVVFFSTFTNLIKCSVIISATSINNLVRWIIWII